MNSAVLTLLRPLVRLLLRYDVPFQAFEELAKRAYVQEAMQSFGIPGRKPTLSRASVLTGLTRKEVQRLVATLDAAEVSPQDSYNRAARVLTGWLRDADFQRADGKPAPLPVNDGPQSFAALVLRYSGDMPMRAVLDELLRVQAVQQRKDGQLELVAKAYVPRAGEVEKLAILGSDVGDLVDTIDHNLQHGKDDPRFQRKVMYRRMPASVRPAFRRLSARESQALLERMDRWLAEHGAADASRDPSSPLVRLGLGIYYFEEAGPADPPLGD